MTCTMLFLGNVVIRWQPKGQLVAHLHEHKAAINRSVIPLYFLILTISFL